MAVTLTITLEDQLFEFATFIKWKNHASSWFANCGVMPNRTLCIDMKGRVCRNGCDFKRADEDGAYPIRVFEILK